jgi:tRNA dimethylallyltransferase
MGTLLKTISRHTPAETALAKLERRVSRAGGGGHGESETSVSLPLGSSRPIQPAKWGVAGIVAQASCRRTYAILLFMDRQRPMVAVVGPTASGKSHLAIELALRFNGEVLNCDSLQMFRWFDLATAKTPESERRGVAHHFLDILDADQEFSAGEFMRRGRERLRDIASRGRLPIVAGGTGFYLRALIDGLAPSPARNEHLRKRLQARADKGGEYLHRLLRRVDSATARTIHANDTPKLIRAIEVCLMAKRPASALFREGRDALTGFRVLKLGIDPLREPLYQRINVRTAEWFRTGAAEPPLIEEVRSIMARGYSTTLPPFQSHGYRQAVDYLEGRLSLEEALYHAQTRTRQYAKRQMTWFRKESGVHWLRGFGNDPALVEEAMRETAEFCEDAGSNHAVAPGAARGEKSWA